MVLSGQQQGAASYDRGTDQRFASVRATPANAEQRSWRAQLSDKIATPPIALDFRTGQHLRRDGTETLMVALKPQDAERTLDAFWRLRSGLCSYTGRIRAPPCPSGRASWPRTPLRMLPEPFLAG